MGLLNRHRFMKNPGLLWKSRIVVFSFIFLGILAGCGSDDEGILLPGAPEITSITPNRGPIGTAVIIEGSGFNPVASENTVTFNAVEAEVVASTPTSIEAFVPEGATTGPVEVTVGDETATGPTFAVESQMPGISSVEPDSGPVGTEVSIRGMNFSPTAAENTITFNDTEAPVNEASDTLLVTEVPSGATTGPVEVTVDGETATGPTFMVVTTGTLEAIVTTAGSDVDNNGYTLTVDGTDSRAAEIEDTLYFENLEEGNHSAELSDVANNCTVTGENPRTVTIVAAETASTTFSISCQSIIANQIVFTSNRDGNNEIYVMNEDGSGQSRLTDNTAADEDPVVSPDGSQIAFASDRDGNGEIYLMDADGNNVVQLTNTTGVENSTPVWSPDGSQLAFSRFTGSQVFEVFVIDVDGSNESNVTNSSTSNDASPAWSPDGTRLAFVSDRGADGDAEIWLMNPDGTGLSQLTDNDDTVSDGSPDWSPDGTQIAFSTNRDQDFEIYIMDADGSNPSRLTTTAGQDAQPSWSPDGLQVVFLSDRDGNGEIYRISTDGNGLINLTVNSANEADPDWSPQN